jgi:hypothetical protein
MGIQAINISSTTPGTPVRVYQPSATKPVLGGNDLQITADPTNAGKVYIGTQGMVKGTNAANRVNVLAVLSAGQQWPQGGSFGGVDPEFLYLDVDTSGDGISVAVTG